MSQWRAGIYVFPEIEVLDFCGPFEVLSVTRLDEERRRQTTSPFEVRLIAATPGPITATGGLRCLPDYTFADCPPLDILIVPGGWGTRALLEDADTLEWLRRRRADTKLLASVCTGALLYARAGLLDGRPVTTHWRSLDLLAQLAPEARVVRDQHVVEDGDLVSSAGISAGIDMALRLVERYCGAVVARATARHMEYPYPEDLRRRVDF